MYRRAGIFGIACYCKVLLIVWYYIPPASQRHLKCIVEQKYRGPEQAPQTSFYQWVTFMMVLQAALFYLPYKVANREESFYHPSVFAVTNCFLRKAAPTLLLIHSHRCGFSWREVSLGTLAVMAKLL